VPEISHENSLSPVIKNKHKDYNTDRLIGINAILSTGILSGYGLFLTFVLPAIGERFIL
jgi:hypothetical protein